MGLANQAPAFRSPDCRAEHAVPASPPRPVRGTELRTKVSFVLGTLVSQSC